MKKNCGHKGKAGKDMKAGKDAKPAKGKDMKAMMMAKAKYKK